MKDTKRVGDITETAVALALLQKGYSVSKPIGDNQKYDLIADNNGTLLRIQCKTARLRKGVLTANAYRILKREGKSKMVKYLPCDIDCFGIYSPDTKKCYLIAVSNVIGPVISLRVEERKVKNAAPERWAAVYELK